MKKIKPAMDDYQVVLMNKQSTFADIARVRKGMLDAIREAIGEAIWACKSDSPGTGQTEILYRNYLAKFDKMLSPE
jgi:hypothetical protein